MNIWKVDDKTKAACDTCGAFVGATYTLRDVPLSDGSDIVKDVLVGVCDRCDSVCVLPHQSVPRVSQTLNRERSSIDSRIPAHMFDILNCASSQVGGSTDFVPQLIKYYLHALAQRQMSSIHLRAYLKSDLAGGKAQKRISLKGQYVSEDIAEVKALAKLDSTSDLIRSIILKINDDILQKKSKKSIKALEGIAAACR